MRPRHGHAALQPFFNEVRNATVAHKALKRGSPYVPRSTNESVTFKMTHFAFVNKGQNQYDYTRNLTLIDKCKMCHFECHGLKWNSRKSTFVEFCVAGINLSCEVWKESKLLRAKVKKTTRFVRFSSLQYACNVITVLTVIMKKTVRIVWFS
jgi:hypothetical protein